MKNDTEGNFDANKKYMSIDGFIFFFSFFFVIVFFFE